MKDVASPAALASCCVDRREPATGGKKFLATLDKEARQREGADDDRTEKICALD